MQVLLNIIYFLLSLTVLVSIHELGHLSMAKLFGVYCSEYSIGFGPAIFSIKPKGVNKKGQPRETKFSLRCVPLGGYVAMAGEGMEDVEELKEVPPHRFLQGVAKWKRAIIMVAGVTLNAILGLVLIICANSINPTANMKTNNFNVSETYNKVVYNAETGKQTSTTEDTLFKGVFDSNTKFKHIKIEYTGVIADKIKQDTKKTDAVFNYTIDPDKLGQDGIYSIGTYIKDAGNSYLPQSGQDQKIYTFTTINDEVKEFKANSYITSQSSSGTVYAWEKLGVSVPGRGRTFGEVFTDSFSDFGNYATLIFRAIGNLFTPGGINNVGGPIAIVQQQMQITSMGFGYFLMFWGLISINLAVINLLPFPGLDGWHLVVCIVEGITRKDINPKVKAIMSAVGLVLLFGLMIAVTIKDILKLFVLIV